MDLTTFSNADHTAMTVWSVFGMHICRLRWLVDRREESVGRTCDGHERLPLALDLGLRSEIALDMPRVRLCPIR